MTQDSFQGLISHVRLQCLGKFLTLFSFVFILMCFEFGVLFSFKHKFSFGALFSFNLCCSFFYKIIFVGLWVQLPCLLSMCFLFIVFFLQLSLLVCNYNQPIDQRVGQLLPPLCLAQCHGHCISNYDDTKHLEVLKPWYYEPKLLGFKSSSSLVAPLLNRWGLDVQQEMFKLCMKSNSKATMEPPFDLNPLT